jgi:hypothetical protein
MKNLKLLSFYGCLTAYYFFFWKENIGINLFIFNLLILSFNFLNLPKNYKTYALLAAGILSSLAVVLLNSDFSIVINFLVMSIVLGYAALPSINSAVSGGMAFAVRLLLSFRYITEPISQLFENLAPRNVLLSKVLKGLKISIIPVILFIIFLVIFQNANPVFEEKTIFLQNLITLLFEKFPTFSIERTIYTFIGFVILNAIFFKHEIGFAQDFLTNTEVRLYPENESKSSDQWFTAVITLISLNLLLLVVNGIDIKYLWFNFEGTTAPEMSKLVHTGTYALIFSTLLSILVLIFFFRGDLNFHEKRKSLILLSFLWIVQNSLLLFSVFIRNQKYIEMYGLTHKRIGVVIFLLITLTILVTTLIKIYKKLNLRFLFTSNSWAIMAIAVILSFVNFDAIIAENNLKRPDCDLNYVKSLSVRVLPVIKKYHPDFKDEEIAYLNQYKKDQEKYTWLSWNLADHRLNQFLIITKP